MNPKIPLARHRAAGTAAVLLLAATIGSAQQPSSSTAGRTAQRRSSAEDGSVADQASDYSDVQRLSPFIVNSSNDIGYYAENTLAGSRLNTNLADLAASITVVTRQQMIDTASIDLTDVFMYEANTEGTENGYNDFRFDGATFVDNNQQSIYRSNRIRGIGAADRSHNYYYSLSAIPFDVYNTETVDINRGPNSMLFGLGSPAGIVNQNSTSATLGKTSGQIEARYGSYEAFRSSLRWNQPVGDKFAIFVAGLYDKRGFERQPSSDNSRRYYGAFTWAPTRRTTLKGSFENWHEDARPPNSVTPQDGITEWRQDGSPTWNPLTFTLTRNGVKTVLPNSNMAKVDGLMGYVNGTRPAMYIDHGDVVLWMQSALSPTGTIATGPFPNTSPQLVSSATQILKLQGSTLPLFAPVGVTDRSIYDWSSINTASGVNIINDANIYNLELNQQILPHLFAAAGWYREDLQKWLGVYNSNGMIMIDPNEVLLDGTPNPFFKRPFFSIGGNNDLNNFHYRNDNYRVSLAYTADFTSLSGWRRWLGLNRLFAFGERHYLGTLREQSYLVPTDPHAWVNPASKTPSAPGSNNIGAVFRPEVFVGYSDGNIAYAPGSFPLLGNSLDVALRQAVPTGNGTYQWSNEPAHFDQLLGSGTSKTEQTDDSITLGWQGSLLNDRIVPTLGFRRDRNISRVSQALQINPITGAYDPIGLHTFRPSQNTWGNTRTGGLVVKPLKWLGLTYDQSRNFTPAAYQVDINGKPLPMPTGKGKDMGIHVTGFNNKLFLTVNYFENSAANSRGAGPAFRVATFERAFVTWANGVASAVLGPGASTDALNQKVAELTGLPAGYSVPDPATTSITSTSTVTAKGIEAQLVYNPLRNWNLKATYGRQRTTYSAIAPEFDSYIGPRLPVWMSATDPTTGIRFWDTLRVPNIGSPSSYWLQNIAAPMKLAQALEGKRTQGQREWNASGITNYEFTSGLLKGVGIGGAIRLQDRAIIGYYGITDSDGVIRSLDPNRPIFDKVNPVFDAWLSKSFALPHWLGRNIRAKVQLNVRNLTEKGNWLQAISVNPDGTPRAFRIVDPRAWYLDCSLNF